MSLIIISSDYSTRHKSCPLHIDAMQHFKYCGIVTLVCITVGALVLAAEVEIFL